MNETMIHRKADAILQALPEITFPIRVEDIVKSNGLKVVPYLLEEEISGMLVIENGVGIITFNQAESRVRRRFTIAHEFGHYILHKGVSSLFVDKMFRASKDYPAYKPENVIYEQEANAFAAALLMPEQAVKDQVEALNMDLGNEKGLKELSKIFDVSTTAMYYRLFNLHLI